MTKKEKFCAEISAERELIKRIRSKINAEMKIINKATGNEGKKRPGPTQHVATGRERRLAKGEGFLYNIGCFNRTYGRFPWKS